MPIEFPLQRKKTPFGTVSNPLIDIHVMTLFGYIPFQFILDTGADCSKLPKSVSELIGIDLLDCPQTEFYGISGILINVYVSKIQIKIANHPLTIQCIFTEDENTPFILGRMDFFKKFNILIDNKNQKIKLTKFHKS